MDADLMRGKTRIFQLFIVGGPGDIVMNKGIITISIDTQQGGCAISGLKCISSCRNVTTDQHACPLFCIRTMDIEELEQTRSLLTSAAFVYLKNIDFSKHTRNLAPASRTILLSGACELYQQMLAKALAHHFEAKLLLLDTTDFSLKIQSKYGASAKPNSLKRSISETTLAGLFETGLSVIQPKPQRKGGLRRQSSVADFGSTEPLQNPSNLRRNVSTAANMNELASNYAPVNPASLGAQSGGCWSFDEKLFVQTLYKVLTNTANNSPIVLYLRDVEKFLGRSQRINTLFQKMLKKISGPILILGSRVADFDKDYNLVDERVTTVFPYTIDIKPPEEENHLVNWKNQLQEDVL
ncbi:hypothetical protein Tco_0486634 [Tanacetum coccineum]